MQHRGYERLLRLYPPAFRSEYADDLVQLFDDLVTDRGKGAAWRRTAIDLLVTVPRYRLERVMTHRASTTVLTWIIVLLATAGVASFLTGMYPGALFVAAALVLGITQRGALARAIRVPEPALRRRRLRIAAALAAVFVVSYALFVVVIGDSWTVRDTVIAVIGTASLFASIVYFIVGLLTPRTPAAFEAPFPS